MMAKPKLSTAVQRGDIVGEDAVAVLLAALGSRPKRLMGNSSTISCSKTKRSDKKTKSLNVPLDSISLQSPTLLKSKLTLVDFKLREMAETCEPGKPHTLQEIADFVGVSRERIRQIEEKGLMRLRRLLTQIVKDDNLDIEEFQR